DLANGINRRIAGLQPIVHHDPALTLEPSGLGQLDIGGRTDRHDNGIALDLPTALQLDFVNLIPAIIELDLIVVIDVAPLLYHLLVEHLATQGIQLPVQEARNPLHNGYFHTHFPQACGHFQSQQPTADNDDRRVFAKKLPEVVGIRPPPHTENPWHRRNI